jgi:multimeric flavodoxin WrbA/putative sterol carrier protein
MADQPKIVAVNGSPHAGMGNSSLMIEMLRPTLVQEGFELEVVHLADLDIRYCTGCAFCMEKGACWIDDDHRRVTGKLFSAQGIILASPVYFLSVTAQMKTFFDRSLAFGHKPRTTWKPGLAVCVSAGLGETNVAGYLEFLLRTFGAFPVGALTAMAVHPGGFWGKEAVEARAADLARDLARAVKENRRYPATDRDLRFYQFMGSLVKSQKDTVMKHDFKHWQEHGFYEGFQAYIQQSPTETSYDPKVREAWIKELIEEQKSKKQARGGEEKKKADVSGASAAKTCRELLSMMPQAFDAAAAGDLTAVYQFEVRGGENFVSHLRVAGGACTYHEGPADKPDLIVRTPADVWLKISRGELSGQQAFMDGRYKTEGDMNLLLKMSRLFSR